MQELDFTSPEAWRWGPCFGAFISIDAREEATTLRDVLRKAHFCEEMDSEFLPKEFRHPHFTRWIFSKPGRWPGPIGFALIDPSDKCDYHILWTYPLQVKYACKLADEGWLFPSAAPSTEAISFVAGLAEIVIELSKMTQFRSAVLISEGDFPLLEILEDHTCYAYSWVSSELEGTKLTTDKRYISFPLLEP